MGKPGTHFSLHSVANNAVTITGILGGGFEADCTVAVWAHDDIINKEIAGNSAGWTQVGEGVLKSAATSSLRFEKPLVVLPEGVVSLFVQAIQGCICLTEERAKNGTFELLPSGYQTVGMAFNATDFVDDLRYSIAGGVEYRGSTEEERCAAVEAEELDMAQLVVAGLPTDETRRRSFAVEVEESNPSSPVNMKPTNQSREAGGYSQGTTTGQPELAMKLKTIFREFDSEQENVITCDRLKIVLQECNPAFTEEELDNLVQVADKNKNGLVEYDEFVDFVCFLRDCP